MTKTFLTASTCALLLVAPACGSGGGGGAPPQPSGAAAEVVECLEKEKVKARAGTDAATLVKGSNARDAVAAEFKGNTANILFFATQEDAAKAKATVKDEERTNIEETVLIVFEKASKPNQEEIIDDCLPETEEQDEKK